MLNNWTNPADKFVNQIGHWTMAKAFPHHCLHCGKSYNEHNPWPELPCPIPDRKPLTRYQKTQLLMLALGSLLIVAGIALFELNEAEPTFAACAFLLFGVAMLCAMVFSPEVQ